MALIRLYMTTSLDGYVTGPRDRVDDLMGIGGSTGRNDPPGPSGQVLGEVMIVAASGAEASSASAQLPASTVSSARGNSFQLPPLKTRRGAADWLERTITETRP